MRPRPHHQDSKKGPGLTVLIVTGLLFGFACGLFFGEYTSWIKWVGDAFIGLLQMAVLPYVATSLVANVGRLSYRGGARLLRVSAGVLLMLWLVGLTTLLIMTQAFPAWETGSFFSSSFTEEPVSPDWLGLFIPSNPFQALSENSIPAVVVFSLGLGIALMSIPDKARLLDPLDVVVEALAKLNKLVLKLTPIGIFAIVAHATGTTDPGQFRLIQGYLLTYAVAAIVLSFVVLPALVSAITSLPFRDIVSASRDPLIAAFVIGNTFVVLPMIIDAMKRLEANRIVDQDSEGHEPEYLVPLAYPFPDVGRIVGLVFIPFAAWFYGTTIDLDRYPAVLGTGLLGAFGKPVITIPLLLNLAELPADIFNLFLASGVIAARFGDLMKTMHLISFAILVSGIINGNARLNWQKLYFGMMGTGGLLLLTVVVIRGYLIANFEGDYSRENLVTERELLFPRSRPLSHVESIMLAESDANPDPIRPGQTRVERIKQRGCMRVGFDPDKMPFAYYNAKGQLIGFDIEMAYHLADDLHVNIEFVPIDLSMLKQQLRDDEFDVAMSALEGTVEQAALLPAVDPYMDVTLAIVVPDYRKRHFRSRDAIEKIPDLKLAVIKGSFFAERAPKVFQGKQDIRIVELDSAAEYFSAGHAEVDGLVISAESGSAWTLRYPGFAVANPLLGRVRVPLYYLTAADTDFEQFLQNWLTLKRADGTYQQLYEYWILGREVQTRTPRWSVLRDLLGWVE
jgi:Na+/H+-dicarboxylate symporter/ABC-type amino acid transport substrate-binding protein